MSDEEPGGLGLHDIFNPRRLLRESDLGRREEKGPAACSMARRIVGKEKWNAKKHKI